MSEKTERIRELNDRLRVEADFTVGRIMLTIGVQSLEDNVRAQVLRAVRDFDDFNADNDPYSEHDFGAVDIENEKYFFKIDYYDNSLQSGSEDPADPEQTTRVMTIMRADEY